MADNDVVTWNQQSDLEVWDDKDCYNLDAIAMTWNEFVLRHRRQAEDKKWLEAFKTLIAKTGKSRFFLNGTVVATRQQVDKFSSKQFEKENPHIFEQYTEYVTEKKFNLERFKQENPDMYQEYLTASFTVK